MPKGRGTLVADRAVEQEKLKQRLRVVAQSTGLPLAQVKALFVHWQRDLEASKTANLTREAIHVDDLDFTGEAAREKLLHEFERVASDFERRVFPPGHGFPYEATKDQLNADADALQFEDYVTGLAYLAKNARPEDRLLFLFQTVDRDGDGCVSHAELMELLGSHCRSENRSETLYTWVKKHFKEADTDRSGSLDFAECLAILRKHPFVLQDIGFDLDAVIKSFASRHTTSRTEADAKRNGSRGRKAILTHE